VPQAPDQRWSLDFVSDCLAARRFRILVVVDDFTRECLAAVADTSLSGVRVARELDILIARRSMPATIVSDNGPELTSRAVLAWTNRAGLNWHDIAPGKPQQNAFVESFMYGRPPRCKEEDSFGRRSGAFMYTACSCGRVHGRWP
jgi:putative transposase